MQIFKLGPERGSRHPARTRTDSRRLCLQSVGPPALPALPKPHLHVMSFCLQRSPFKYGSANVHFLVVTVIAAVVAGDFCVVTVVAAEWRLNSTTFNTAATTVTTQKPPAITAAITATTQELTFTAQAVKTMSPHMMSRNVMGSLFGSKRIPWHWQQTCEKRKACD